MRCKRMTSGDLIPTDHNGSEPPSLEVEFALVIARMIDSLAANPEDMRQAVYDLARYKLREQLPQASAEEIDRTERALETAIRGVESFSAQHVAVLAPALQSQLNGPGPEADRLSGSLHQGLPPARFARNSVGLSRIPHLMRTAVMIAIFVGVLAAVQQREHLLSLVHSSTSPEGKTGNEERKVLSQVSSQSVPAQLPAKPSIPLPTDYGVYAISNGSLFELSLLPGRPPDIRVAISAALTTPSRTVLPNGHPKFIVFRRDIASSIADRAEVRIIAKVAREFSVEAGSKKPADATWVMRNISFPFRLSPVNDRPEMYQLHSEDPGLELTPGRYALVLTNQAYDFSVEGNAVDPKHCIERIAASNGTFYSECKGL